jgi:hypothetical protein
MAAVGSSKKKSRFLCPYCRERYFTAEFRDSHAISWCKKRPVSVALPASAESSERDEQVDSLTMEHVVKNLNDYMTHQSTAADLATRALDASSSPPQGSSSSQDPRVKFSCQYCHEQFFSEKYCDRHVLKCSHRHTAATATATAPSGSSSASAPLELLQTPNSKTSTKKYSTPNSGELRDLAISLTKQLLSVHATSPMRGRGKDQDPSVAPHQQQQGMIFTCPEPACNKKQFKSENGLKSHLRDLHRVQYQPAAGWSLSLPTLLFDHLSSARPALFSLPLSCSLSN